MATDAAPAAGNPDVEVEPPYSRSMPWVLIGAAVVLAIIMFASREGLHSTSVVVVQSRLPAEMHKSDPLPTRGSISARARAETLPPEKETTTETQLSDTVFTTLLGIAAALFVLGAFYSRITKVTIAGNTVEFNAVPAATSAKDAKAITAKVNERLPEQLRAAAGNGDAVPAEEATRIAQLGAAAAAQALLDATYLRAAASAATPAAGAPPAITIKSDEMKALGKGMPLPDSLLERLADRAFEELEKDQS